MVGRQVRVETVPGGGDDSGQRGWLGNGMTGRFGPTRFATLPTVGAADHGNDGKPLALGTNGIANQGQWYEVVGGRADNCSVQGAGVLRLEKRKFVFGRGY